jgi:hypothetical protein
VRSTPSSIRSPRRAAETAKRPVRWSPVTYTEAWRRLTTFLRHPAIAYTAIVLLQLKVMWGLWRYKEMEAGDTTSYLYDGWVWYDRAQNNIAWSPLYTVSLGTLMQLTPNANTVTLLQRVLAALASSVMVLAVMRRLLPHPLAWLVAAWWAVLPINFDTMYTVHQFAVLPLLLAWLAVVRLPQPWNRGVALGVLVATTFLVRNEIFVAVACWALVCVLWELRTRRRARRSAALPDQGARAPGMRRAGIVLASYVLPLLAAGLLVAFFYSRSTARYPELRGVLRDKHTVNMGQVYAFGYYQRHPEWTENPWLAYPVLMKRDFGAQEVSLTEMIWRNPRAYLTHAAWNLRLTPAGVQMMLFNCTTAEVSPDYAPLNRAPRRAAGLSALAIFAVAAGGVLVLWRRRFWRRAWFGPRAHGWLVMLCVASTALLVIPTQRPRPSYLFSLSILLMAVVAAGAFVVGYSLFRWRPLRRVKRSVTPQLPLVMPLVMLAVILAASNPYKAAYRLARRQGQRVSRPILEMYERMLPHQSLIERDATVFLVDAQPGEMQYLIQHGKGRTYTSALYDQMRPEESLAAFLDRSGVNLLYLDLHMASGLEGRRPGIVAEFLRAAPAAGWVVADAGWQMTGDGGVPAARWVFLWKPRDPTPSQGDLTALSPFQPVPPR